MSNSLKYRMHWKKYFKVLRINNLYKEDKAPLCRYSMSSKSSKNTRKTCQSVHLPFCFLCLVILQRLITTKNIEYIMKLRFFSLSVPPFPACDHPYGHIHRIHQRI